MFLPIGQQLMITIRQPHLAHGIKFRVPFPPIVLEIWRHERNKGGGQIGHRSLRKKVPMAPLEGKGHGQVVS